VRVLVVGNGAREDALSWRLTASPSCEAVFAAPGNAGTASRGENWAIPATNGRSLANRCLQEAIDLVVLGPETAIAAGVGDRLRDAGIATFGPDRSAGRLESSKFFAKRFMERHDIPTARAVVVHSLSGAMKALDEWSGPCVIKADGLAAGSECARPISGTRDQYSLASMIVRTRVVFDGSAGSSEPNSIVAS